MQSKTGKKGKRDIFMETNSVNHAEIVRKNQEQNHENK